MKKLLALSLALTCWSQANAATIYSSYSGSQTGITIRNEMLEQSAFLPMPFAPAAIADGVNNTFYVTSGNNIFRYNSKGKEIAHFAWEDTSINYTGAVVAGGSVYVTYTGSQTGVSVRNVKTLEQTNVIPMPFAPEAIAIGADKSIFVAAANHLYKYDASGKQLVDMNFPDKGIIYTDIDVQGDTVYAAYRGSQTGFTVRSAQTLQQSKYVAVPFSPTGIAVGSDNDLYLSAQDNLYRYAVAGQQLKAMNFPKILYTDVAFDGR